MFSIKNIQELIPLKRSKDFAFKMGVDCSLNGPNVQNCHFSIFSTPRNTKAWEDGKKYGDTLKSKATVK